MCGAGGVEDSLARWRVRSTWRKHGHPVDARAVGRPADRLALAQQACMGPVCARARGQRDAPRIRDTGPWEASGFLGVEESGARNG